MVPIAPGLRVKCLALISTKLAAECPLGSLGASFVAGRVEEGRAVAYRAAQGAPPGDFPGAAAAHHRPDAGCGACSLPLLRSLRLLSSCLLYRQPS